MQLLPKDLFEKLEFDKVLHLLEQECMGEPGRALVRELVPSDRKSQIEVALSEAQEFARSIEHNDHFPVRAYESVDEELEMLKVEGYVLPIKGLQNLNLILLFTRDVFRFFNARRRETYPMLYKAIREVSFNEDLIKAIEGVIDEEGNIRPDASPELMRIRRQLGSKQKELEQKFRVIINQYRSKGWLTDNVESFRNGRRVLSVPSEHKRSIRGIIHDESTTGKTAFIEPEGIIEINNDIFDLETDEKREIYRILRELSAELRPYREDIRTYQDILIHFDFVQAKARLARQMNAVMPKTLFSHPHFGVRQGRHPLLYLKNKRLNKVTVPFDFNLFKGNRILMLSGPNAGGKSITLKSIGLMQLMLQSGLLVPVDQESEMGIFKALFADIGDQQSIEDDLSTYSSRLENMRNFLERSDKDSLVLIDEFGSGTDPKIGGAIAESILRQLNEQRIYGVITTHYSNLKIYAFKTKGIVNASMNFDKDTLSPTYELQVGRPGSSYAFEIAEKSGLSNKILNYAKHRTGKNEKAVDQLLVELQQEKQEAEEKLAELTDKQKKLDALIRNYEQLHKELEYRRKKVKLEAKEWALQQTSRDNREMENLIREIKEQQNLEKAKRISRQVKQQRGKLAEQVTDLREKIYYEPTEKDKKKEAIKAGDFVKMKTGGATGTVESVDKNRAVVRMGEMRMTIKLRDLQHANAPLEVQSGKSVQSQTSTDTASFQPKLDIRGMRYEEALKVVEDFVDQALIANAAHLEIVHGKGSGALREAVRRKLREYNVPMDITHPPQERGGDGVTLVEM
ncbi:MAG: endonuclease MutS2 [Phaeodactylibacter xiamenensis]|uniref:Endonuclease MutS2 n=1 Tax=Phaeodactylibacter xiamenensis TaxID=1524460 RepID=A0A098S1E9_9BACT|nr:endonuclease MutS2 [Phaeodactylibacter xiamenensis]KGE85663.1 DNA mismatch repair protein MutS [Phaeodactylibacter xiamenensis]MCR9051783.1 endonuclease MutS2 [bacterium]